MPSRWVPEDDLRVLLRAGGILASLGLLGQEDGVDVGDDTSRRDAHVVQELVELLIIADGQLDVAGDDADLLVVAGSIASKLQDLSCQVFLRRVSE